MIKQKNLIFRIICFVLCFSFMFSLISFADDGEKTVKAVFIGNADTPNQMIKSYAELTGEYIKERTRRDTEIITTSYLDIDSEDFLNIVKNNILPQNADIIFWEIDLSHKNKGNEKEIKEKISAVVSALCSGEKIPAIYFVYVPEASFRDYRKTYDTVAKQCNIKIIDGFEAFKKQYKRGWLETSDFLSAGRIIGENGHEYLSKIIIQELKGVSDILKSTDISALSFKDFEKYAVSVEEIFEIKDPTEGVVFYVSKSGNDKADGSLEKPFATLDRARKAVNKVKEQQGDNFKGAVVYIREGDYRFDTPFKLNADDSATDDTKIVYSAYPGEKVRFTNAYKLEPEKWKPVTDEDTLLRIRENARGKVYYYDLAKNGINAGSYREGGKNNYRSRDGSNYKMGSVFVADGVTERRAAYPNGGYSRVSQTQTTEKNKIYYDDIVGDRWKTADNAWMKGMLNQGYYTDYIKISGFDFVNKTINLPVNAGYGVTPGHTWSIYNLLEELDMEGEWFLDEKTKLVYYYPRGDINNQEILYSSNLSAVVSMNSTKNITFKDIEFTTCSGSAVEINDGIGNTVENCKIGNTGFHGVTIFTTKNKVGPGKNLVTGCHIYNTAISAVTVTGGDRVSLVPQYDAVTNCLIENYSYENHSETAALQSINAVGVIFKNNTIHNDDSCAVWMGGNEELIEYNEIYNVGYETDDYGVVYGTSTGALTQGVTFRNNYFHDCVYSGLTYVYGKLGTIYFDALRNNGAVVENNAFINCDEPIFLATNQNMTARGNVGLDCKKSVVTGYYSHVNTTNIPAIHDRIRKETADGSIFNYTSQTGTPDTLVWRSILEVGRKMTDEEWKNYYLRYPWVEHYLERGPLVHRDNVASGNASFNSKEKLGIGLPQDAAGTVDVTNNYVTNDTIEYSESGSEYERMDKAMAIAAENIEGFQPWDVRDAGILGSEIPVGNFNILYPADGEENIDLKVFPLCWDFASGADEYAVTVASDPEFKNIVFEGKTNVNYIFPTGLSYGGKRYYWKVKASSYSEKFTGEPLNANGIRSFVTKREEDIDKKELVKAINNTNTFLKDAVEGTKGGMYPEGTLSQLNLVLDEANKINEMPRVKQDEIVKIARKLDETILKAKSSVVLEEVNFADVFDAPQNIFIGKSALSGVGDYRITANEKGVTFKGSGSAFANRDFAPYEIINFKGKFDFSGYAAASNYTMFCIRASGYSDALFDVTNYAFLVTKDNIELQAFKKPTNEGKMYLTVPNTFIEEGKEHNIEFGAVPANDGKAIRLILAIDGKIVYDEIDNTNIIMNSGKVGFVNSRDTHGLTIMHPDSNLPYPTLLEQLNDPNSALNNK